MFLFIKKMFLLSGILISFIIFINNSSINDDDDVLVESISKLLIKEYDKYKNLTAMEKLVLKLSRKAYIGSINDWEKNYKNLQEIKIKLHPVIEKIVKISEKNISNDESMQFRKLFENLTMLGFKNLQIYYTATKQYVKKSECTEINIELLNEATSEIEYYQQKITLYEEEENIKNEIRKYFKDKRIKNKLSFYSFAFEFLDKIRVDIIKKDMKKMKQKIEEKEEKIIS